ncbi:5-oxoprolinase subunit PxpA [bacterium]|nr:5-oxoprolinase subunit PxpA [bacterium]
MEGVRTDARDLPAPRVDLNCDLGESFGHWSLGCDRDVLAVVSSANVACGMHAGDPVVMRRTIGLARDAGCSVGAHPGYPDLQGFGRRALAMAPEDVYAYVQYQVAALAGMCRAQGVTLRHVKPHGALYNASARDERVAAAVARAVADLDDDLVLVGLAGSASVRAARAAGLRVAEEFFADRGYAADGALVPRDRPGALVTDATVAAARTLRAVTRHEVVATDGTVLPVTCDTVCVHGDNPAALAFARAVRDEIRRAGVTVAPTWEARA